MFIITFLSLYAGLHLLFYWGIFPLIKSRPLINALTGFWLILMLFSPLIIRALENTQLHSVARTSAWIGFIWMGVIFIAASVFLLWGLWELSVWIIGFFFTDLPAPSLRTPRWSTVALTLIAAVSLYGIYEATNIRIERITIKTAKLPKTSQPITAAHISDMHLGLLRSKGELQDVGSRLNQLKPDIIFATGDTVDALPDNIDPLIEIWRNIDPPLGKFTVIGNHEYYAGLTRSQQFLEDSGFTVLRNQNRQVGKFLNIAGVDDPAGGSPGDEAKVLASIDRNRYTILLKHRPTIDRQAAKIFDLQLSGHTHGGQIFPFGLITGWQYPMQKGLHKLYTGSLLYTNPGTGTWGPPMRVGSKPEITLLEIEHATFDKR